MRPMNRGALADIHATAVRIEAERDAYNRELSRRAREHRTPRPVPVMLEVHVGDTVRLVSNALATVVKVNRKSVVTEGGNRWAAGEFEVMR